MRIFFICFDIILLWSFCEWTPDTYFFIVRYSAICKSYFFVDKKINARTCMFVCNFVNCFKFLHVFLFFDKFKGNLIFQISLKEIFRQLILFIYITWSYFLGLNIFSLWKLNVFEEINLTPRKFVKMRITFATVVLEYRLIVRDKISAKHT